MPLPPPQASHPPRAKPTTPTTPVYAPSPPSPERFLLTVTEVGGLAGRWRTQPPHGCPTPGTAFSLPSLADLLKQERNGPFVFRGLPKYTQSIMPALAQAVPVVPKQNLWDNAGFFLAGVELGREHPLAVPPPEGGCDQTKFG